MKKAYIFYFLSFLFILACKQGQDETTEESMSADEEKNYTLTPFSESIQYDDAAITSMEYRNGTFRFGIGGESYELGVQTPDAPQKMCANSAEGQHIHLIDGPRPYLAEYTARFDHEMEDGQHYLLAFLSRSYHESIKTDAAHVAKVVQINNNSISSQEDITNPMLFYSRPKGTYVGGDTDKIMLDFYLLNCNLGTDYTVKAVINGEEHLIDKWQPYYIEGLPMGDNVIELTLLGSEGEIVNAPHNPVQRTFELVAEPEM